MDHKKLIKRSALPYFVMAAGGTGLVLRVLLYTLGMDNRGLLPRDHPLHLITLLLAAVTTAALAWACPKLDGSNSSRKNFPPSVPAALGTVFSGVWMLSTAFTLVGQAREGLDHLLAALGFFSVPCLLYTGNCRRTGNRPFFLAHGLLCLFLAVYMLCQYRRWSGNPQLPDYVFHVFACVFLMLTAYCRTAFDVGKGSRRMHLFCSLMAGFLCFLCLVGDGHGTFYFGGGIWALSNLCRLQLPPSRDHTDTIRIPNLPERS